MSREINYYGIRLSKKELEQLLWALDNCGAYFPIREKLDEKLEKVKE